LNLLVEEPAPLWWVLPKFRGEHANVLPIPGFKPSDYAEVLLRLIQDGQVQLVVEGQGCVASGAPDIVQPVWREGPGKIGACPTRARCHY
jgi:hypothetical protein